MPNDFYTPTGNPTDNSNIVSSDMRAEFAAINAGFNKLPTLTGNANKLVVINSSGTGMDVTTAPAGLTSVNKIALTQPANGATLTILDGKTLTVNHSLTLAGTDGTVMTFPSTSASVARIDAAQTFVGTQTYSGLIAANLGLTVTGAAFNSRGITDSATAKVLTLSGSGANSVTIANSATNPTIDSSGTSELLVNKSLLVDNVASAVNYIQISGTTTTTGSAFVLARGADTNVALILSGQGGSGITLATVNGTIPQVSIIHTASADRYITLTGSNGGNPTIGTSAGGLTISPATGFTTHSNPAGASLITSKGGAGYGGFFADGAAAAYYFSGISGVEVTRIASNASGFSFQTGTTALTQVAVAHTASADRYITLTGANGANPKISTSAGSLDIGATVVFTSQTVGTTVGAAGGASALPATPLGYLTTAINGTACKVPYYTA